MIQRIQTLYLLAIVILAGCTMCLPVAGFVNSTKGFMYELGVTGINQIQGNQIINESSAWALTALSAVIAVFAFYGIVSYKNRQKQIRFSVINFLFMIGYYVALLIYVLLAANRLDAEWSLRLTTVFPLVCMILNYLAIGAIGKDEKLVRSADRIR